MSYFSLPCQDLRGSGTSGMESTGSGAAAEDAIAAAAAELAMQGLLV